MFTIVFAVFCLGLLAVFTWELLVGIGMVVLGLVYVVVALVGVALNGGGRAPRRPRLDENGIPYLD